MIAISHGVEIRQKMCQNPPIQYILLPPPVQFTMLLRPKLKHLSCCFVVLIISFFLPCLFFGVRFVVTLLGFRVSRWWIFSLKDGVFILQENFSTEALTEVLARGGGGFFDLNFYYSMKCTFILIKKSKINW